MERWGGSDEEDDMGAMGRVAIERGSFAWWAIWDAFLELILVLRSVEVVGTVVVLLVGLFVAVVVIVVAVVVVVVVVAILAVLAVENDEEGDVVVVAVVAEWRFGLLELVEEGRVGSLPEVLLRRRFHENDLFPDNFIRPWSP